MKATGIVRPVDRLGRIVLPKELRTSMGFNDKDALEIYTDGNKVILQKYEPACIFCDQTDEILEFEGKKICKHCLAKLAQAHAS